VKNLLLLMMFGLTASVLFAQPITLVKIGPSEKDPFVYEKYIVRKMKIEFDEDSEIGSLHIETSHRENLVFDIDSVVGYIDEQRGKTYRIYQDTKYQVVYGKLECSVLCYTQNLREDGSLEHKKNFFFALDPTMSPIKYNKENIIKWLFDGDQDKFRSFLHESDVNNNHDIVEHHISRLCKS